MKTFEEIVEQEPVFLHQFQSPVDVFGEFSDVDWQLRDEENAVKAAQLRSDFDRAGGKILFATYGYANYSGNAFVLFAMNGKLYEVNGGHCSCYGLEGQWKPEETTLEVIKHRLIGGELGRDEYSDNLFVNELGDFLGIPANEYTRAAVADTMEYEEEETV